MIQIAICDDEIGTCADIENLIISYAKSHALQIETEVFYSGETLYDSIQGEYTFDLIFLDIELFNCAPQEITANSSDLLLEPISEHGYGLKNVRRIVEKYHGNLVTDITDGIFSANVLLFMTDVIQG